MKGGAAYVVSGIVFGFGLALSGMVRPEVVLSFLKFQDLGLLFVLGVGILITLIGFYTIPQLRKKALDGSDFTLRKQVLDKNLIIGCIIFGIGWGMTGICPGACIASVGVGNWPILWAVLGIFMGTYAYGWFVHVFRNDEF